MIITDANGNADILTICTRCGQPIKNKTMFRGKWYGPECILIVTGQKVDHWIIKDGQIDEQATADRDNARKVKIQADNDLKQANFTRNSQENAWIINVLKPHAKPAVVGGFINDIISWLEYNPLKTLSERQAEIVADIYAKHFGRTNSKKYNNAYDEFWNHYED